MLPSVEIACNIVDILDVSLDYLTGKTDVEMGKDIQKCILEVTKFDQEDRNNIFFSFIAKGRFSRLCKKPNQNDQASF